MGSGQSICSRHEYTLKNKLHVVVQGNLQTREAIVHDGNLVKVEMTCIPEPSNGVKTNSRLQTLALKKLHTYFKSNNFENELQSIVLFRTPNATNEWGVQVSDDVTKHASWLLLKKSVKSVKTKKSIQVSFVIKWIIKTHKGYDSVNYVRF